MGVLFAIVISASWFSHLFLSLIFVEVNFASPLFYFHIILQAYFFTGLFITAHDAMHGTVSPNKTINNIIGMVTAFLFVGLAYSKLLKNHRLHHRYPGTPEDPDFSAKSNNFFVWFGKFMMRYLTIYQVLIVALIFNILKLIFNETSVWFFYVIPAFLGTLQLFYFGTYRPHKQPHTHDMKPHNARTLKPNHFWAMISCYFFGYHSEHHHAPHIPWWKLYKLK